MSRAVGLARHIVTVASGSPRAFPPSTMCANQIRTIYATLPVTPSAALRPTAAASDTHPEAT